MSRRLVHTSLLVPDDDEALQSHGVHFTETPRAEAYGGVVVCIDPWGNRWDLIENKVEAAA